jgi:uncharacterized protein (DUF2267 family)
MILNFNKYASEGEAFLKELAVELGYPDDRNRAARVLRSIIHTLRDIITPEENVAFLAQLPMFLKAVYVEGWTLKPAGRIRNIEQLIDAIRGNDTNTAGRDFSDDEEVEKSVSVIFKVLRRYVSLGEMEDIRAVLPKGLKPLLNDVLMV